MTYLEKKKNAILKSLNRVIKKVQKVKSSITGSMIISDADEQIVSELEVVGNTEFGKNIFNMKRTFSNTENLTTDCTWEYDIVDNSLKIMNNSTGSFKAIYPSISEEYSNEWFIGKTITVSCKLMTSSESKTYVRIGYVKSTGTYSDFIIGVPTISSPNEYVEKSFSYTFQELPTDIKDGTKICITLYSNGSGTVTSAENNWCKFKDIQIEIGDTKTEYEDYYKVGVGVHTKNYFNLDKYKTGYLPCNISNITDTGMKLSLKEAGKKFVTVDRPAEDLNSFLGQKITLSGDWTISGNANGLITINKAKNGKIVSQIGNLTTSGGKTTMTLPSSFDDTFNGFSILIYANWNTADASVGDGVEYSNIQIELGDQKTDYEKYGYNVIIKNSNGNLIDNISYFSKEQLMSGDILQSSDFNKELTLYGGYNNISVEKENKKSTYPSRMSITYIANE